VAGSIAAVTARRHYPDVSILVVRPEPETVIPCGIPYLFGTLGSCDLNLMPSDRLPAHNVDLLIDRVQSFDRAAHTAVTEGGETIAWTRLLLATGSTPVVPPIPGADLPGVFQVVKQVEYLERALAAMRESKNVVFVGCGLIGLELAEEFRKKDLNVTVVDGEVMVGNATVTMADINTTNGVIHVIDQVLVPASVNLTTENQTGMQATTPTETVATTTPAGTEAVANQTMLIGSVQ